MSLFGVETFISMPLRTNKSRVLEPLLNEWFKVHRDYVELANSEDSLYWYNERSNISALAGAVWRKGGFAQEEYTSSKGSSNDEISGRIDLFMHLNGMGAVCEAKQLYLYLPENNKKCLSSAIKNSLEHAKKDLSKTTAAVSYHDFALALTFVIPYYKVDSNIDRTERKLQKALDALDCSFYARLKIQGKKPINSYGNVFDSVILVGYWEDN